MKKLLIAFLTICAASCNDSKEGNTAESTTTATETPQSNLKDNLKNVKNINEFIEADAGKKNNTDIAKDKTLRDRFIDFYKIGHTTTEWEQLVNNQRKIRTIRLTEENCLFLNQEESQNTYDRPQCNKFYGHDIICGGKTFPNGIGNHLDKDNKTSTLVFNINGFLNKNYKLLGFYCRTGVAEEPIGTSPGNGSFSTTIEGTIDDVGEIIVEKVPLYTTSTGKPGHVSEEKFLSFKPTTNSLKLVFKSKYENHANAHFALLDPLIFVLMDQ